MRSLFVVLAVATAAAPAAACPRGALCAAIDTAREEAPAAPNRTVSLRIERVPDRTPWRFDDEPAERPAIEMPWIWQVLRQQVMGRMPRYRDDNGLTFVVSPVVVTSTDDSVPGVGIAGDF